MARGGSGRLARALNPVAGAPGEFDLIARIRERAATRPDVLLGIGDDAAILRIPAGHDLVVSTDTLNAGVHFPHETSPFDIGWKALAVNLSDLAAMGAEPAWCTLNLGLPEADAGWLDGFLDGFLALASRHRVALVGGDTTRGPLSITVTVHGFVPHDAALRRDGARVGDDVWVSGTLGDAAAGLKLHPVIHDDVARMQPGDGQGDPGLHPGHALLARLNRPTPRILLGLDLRSFAHACIDVSDGLLADLGHVLDASGVGACIESASLPTSPELAACFDAPARKRFQLGGGDDYELCFTAPPARAGDVIAAAERAGVAVARIGRIEAARGLRLRGRDGSWADAPKSGYRHFDAAHDGAGDA